MLLLIYFVIGFFLGCALTWVSMMNMVSAANLEGYTQGFQDAKNGELNAK